MSVPQSLGGKRLYYFTTNRSGTGRTVDDRPPEHVELAYRAASARRLAAHQDTPANLPMPMTLECKVVNTFSERTLTVRLPDKAGGPQRTAWQRAWQGLKQAEEAGYPVRGAQQLYARAGSDRVAYARTGGAWDELSSFFPVDPSSVYSKLIGKPGLYAFVTVDLSKGYFTNCTFRHHGEP